MNYTLQFWLVALPGWVNREQQHVIAYLREESRVYREMLDDRGLRFNDEQRRRLASKAKALDYLVSRGRRRVAVVLASQLPSYCSYLAAGIAKRGLETEP